MYRGKDINLALVQELRFSKNKCHPDDDDDDDDDDNELLL